MFALSVIEDNLLRPNKHLPEAIIVIKVEQMAYSEENKKKFLRKNVNYIIIKNEMHVYFVFPVHVMS